MIGPFNLFFSMLNRVQYALWGSQLRQLGKKDRRLKVARTSAQDHCSTSAIYCVEPAGCVFDGRLAAAASGGDTFTVFPGHLHRSAIKHFSHSGRRATHT